MSMSVEDLKSEINDDLKRVAEILHIKNYSGHFEVESEKGNGFLGEFFMADILDKDNNKKVGVAVKKAAPREAQMREYVDIPSLYQNENYFYTDIFPTLDNFQKTFNLDDSFNGIPTFFFGSSDLFKEKLVMKNLLDDGYQLHDKSKIFDENHLELVFKQYGKFHALSFAFKNKYPTVFETLTSKYEEPLNEILNSTRWSQYRANCIEKVLKYLEEKNSTEVVEKFRKYGSGGCNNIFKHISMYKGQYTCLTHGDCWANNMLFKYDLTGKPQAMCMIDFQLARPGLPVFDLSYFCYAVASKEQLDNVYHYLDIYYDSFSNFAEKLNCNPEQLYPKDQLKTDWKNYAKFGLCLALANLPVRSMKKEEIAEQATAKKEENGDDDIRYIQNIEFLNLGADLVTHCCKTDVL